jgi:Uma2 family endonuclease
MEKTKALKSPTETAVGKTRSYTEYTESTILERRKRRLLPISFEKRAAMNIREVRVNASFEEYLNLAYDCEYRLHYSDGQVISFIEIDQKTNTIMGEATVSHERLVARFIQFLANLFDAQGANCQVLGSNVKIFIAEDHKAYNPDVAVVKGEVIEKKYKYNKRTSSGIANPYIIVEVLSDSTRRFDLSDKLRDYQLIPSLEQVIFVEQGTVWASTFIRKNANEWRNITFDSSDAQIPVGDGFISLEKIYAKPF